MVPSIERRKTCQTVIIFLVRISSIRKTVLYIQTHTSENCSYSLQTAYWTRLPDTTSAMYSGLKNSPNCPLCSLNSNHLAICLALKDFSDSVEKYWEDDLVVKFLSFENNTLRLDLFSSPH